MTYPTITPLPPAPQRTQAPDAFATTADTFIAALPDLVTEVNAAGDYIDNKAIVVGNDFQGVYSAGTTYSIGESVESSGKYYVSLVNSNTGNTPASSPSQWSEVNIQAVSLSTIEVNSLTGTTPTLNYDTYSFFKHAPTAATTYTFSGTAVGARFSLVVDDSNGSSYDVANALQTNAFALPSSNIADDLYFTEDGLKLFVASINGSNVNDVVYQYTLSKAFDIGTAGLTYTLSVNAQDQLPRGISFNNDGTRMFVLGSSVYQYNLSTPFTLSTASYSGTSYSVASQDTSPTSIRFNNDGTKMFILGSTGDSVYQYSLTTAFVISSGVTFDGSYSVSGQETTPQGLAFNADGTKMFVVGQVGDDVNEYDLATPFTVTSGVTFNTVHNVLTGVTNPTSVLFSPTGGKMYVGASDDIYEYSVGSVFPLTFPASVEIPLGFDAERQVNTKTAFEFVTSDTGSTYQCINVQGGIF